MNSAAHMTDNDTPSTNGHGGGVLSISRETSHEDGVDVHSGDDPFQGRPDVGPLSGLLPGGLGVVCASSEVGATVEDASGEGASYELLPERFQLADRKLSEMMMEVAHVKRLKAEWKKGEARVLEIKAQFDALVGESA